MQPGESPVSHLRPEAVSFLTYQEKKSDVNAIFPQPVRGGDLGGDDSFGIARSPAINPSGIFGRWNKRRHRIHVSRENDGGARLLRRSRVHVAAAAFDGKLIRLVSQAKELAVKNIAYEGFVAGDRFNVYELTGESDDIHGNENNLRRGAAQSCWGRKPGARLIDRSMLLFCFG